MMPRGWMENISKHPWAGSLQNKAASKKLADILRNKGGLTEDFEKVARSGSHHSESKSDTPHCSAAESMHSQNFSRGGVYTQTAVVPMETLPVIIAELKGPILDKESNKHSLGMAWLEKKVGIQVENAAAGDDMVKLVYTGYSAHVWNRMGKENEYRQGGGNAQMVNLFWQAVRTIVPIVEMRRVNLVRA